jgi:small-conductance mechanosensitive channel
MTDAREPTTPGAGGAPRSWGPVRAPQVPSGVRRQWVIAASCGTGAIVVMAVASTLGNVHAQSVHQRLVAFIGAGVFVVLAVIAVRATASALTALVAANAGASTGGAVRIFVSLTGYVIIFFVALGLLGVPLEHLLVGGVVTSVVIGIAAQQALGNVFAGIVLLLTRPFTIGDRIRIRAGALGGIFDGTVTSTSLVYTTIVTDDGVVNIPNSTLLAVGVGPAPDAPPRAGGSPAS